MYLREHNVKLQLPSDIFTKYNLKETAFFDIETTGFDKENDRVILISLGFYEDESQYRIIQYFAESLSDEYYVLKGFQKDLKNFNTWCSYNGKAFDEPFIKKRTELLGLNFVLPQEHIDLFRIIRPFHKQMGLERCNLKTVEKYLGIDRKDKIDGAISVQLYNEYLQIGTENLRDILMLHNYEDVLNLPPIFKLVYEVDKMSRPNTDDNITEKQLSYLKFLIKKNRIDVENDIDKITKKSAITLIDSILKGNVDSKSLNDLIIKAVAG
jgi:uncharacterized protein